MLHIISEVDQFWSRLLGLFGGVTRILNVEKSAQVQNYEESKKAHYISFQKLISSGHTNLGCWVASNRINAQIYILQYEKLTFTILE